MSALNRLRGKRGRGTDMNLSPLIDMMFILLIFFLVTTTFVKEAGVEVERPEAQTAETREKASMVVGIDERNQIHIEGEQIDKRMVRPRMERFVRQSPQGSVVIAADSQSSTDILIQVLDACRLVGIQNISVAARRPEN